MPSTARQALGPALAAFPSIGRFVLGKHRGFSVAWAKERARWSSPLRIPRSFRSSRHTVWISPPCSPGRGSRLRYRSSGWPPAGRAYLTTRYEDVRRVLTDPVFSSRAAATRPGVPVLSQVSKIPYLMLKHGTRRTTPGSAGWVTKAFSVRSVERLRPGVRDICELLVDRMLAIGPPSTSCRRSATRCRRRSSRSCSACPRPTGTTAALAGRHPVDQRACQARGRAQIAELIGLPARADRPQARGAGGRTWSAR